VSRLRLIESFIPEAAPKSNLKASRNYKTLAEKRSPTSKVAITVCIFSYINVAPGLSGKKRGLFFVTWSVHQIKTKYLK
jgi:hypothetical protein